MSEPEAKPPAPGQLLQEAAAWFARMRGPEAEASRGEFEAWLRRGALHRQAYNRAAEIFAMGKILAEESHASEAAPAAIADERRRPRLVRAALGALVLLVAAGWLALQVMPTSRPSSDRLADNQAEPPPAAAELSTPAGQARAMRIPDGSVVTLQGDSLLEVRLSSSERRFHLRRGRVRFEVFHEPRPFVVDAGGGRVTARGTVFDVGFSAGRRVTVRLITGAVDVTIRERSAPDGPSTTRRLRPGETLSYAASSAGPAAASAPFRERARITSSAAPQAARDYDGVTVAELIAQANRGAVQPIRLADAAIGERRVSGRFRIDDTIILAERLALLFDLAVDRGRPGEIVLRPR